MTSQLQAQVKYEMLVLMKIESLLSVLFWRLVQLVLKNKVKK